MFNHHLGQLIVLDFKIHVIAENDRMKEIHNFKMKLICFWSSLNLQNHLYVEIVNFFIFRFQRAVILHCYVECFFSLFFYGKATWNSIAVSIYWLISVKCLSDLRNNLIKISAVPLEESRLPIFLVQLAIKYSSFHSKSY